MSDVITKAYVVLLLKGNEFKTEGIRLRAEGPRCLTTESCFCLPKIFWEDKLNFLARDTRVVA